MKKVLSILLLAAAVAVVLGIKNNKQQNAAQAGCEGGMCVLPFPQEKMMPESAAADAEIKPQALPKLLDLGAGKCVPCKAMAPILDEMKETFAGQLNVDFIDVWENEGAAEQYGIRMIPTQVFFDAEGKELFRHEGFYAREEMLAKWAELGYGFNTNHEIH